ncbi:hypothetical protein N7516_003348, partial [Penicillium verrucosum]|uniref:uncharacterized protein n=1 Tax=Penicillium verrucosum TaxID=60171 RepID=UPI00254500BC
MELSHSLDNEDTRTPASSTAVGVRVWYGLYWRKMAVVQAMQVEQEQELHSPEQQLQVQGDMMNIDL